MASFLSTRLQKEKHCKGVPAIKQVLPAEKIKHVGAFFERPRTNTVRPYGKKDREFHILCPFFTRLAPQGYGVLHFIGVLSGDKIAFSCGRRGTAIAVDEELI